MARKHESSRWIVTLVLGVAVLALWIFPSIWYVRGGTGDKVWFVEQTELPGWTFEEMPISAAAERTLVADRTVSGEFRGEDGVPIRVFSAKRYVENPNEIGLFVHTPDRCWVEGGWKIEPAEPGVQELTVHGVPLQLERRIFDFRGNRELVYFCGLVDGRVLPYRLDHNLSGKVRSESGMRTARFARSTHFWTRLWESFTNRRELSGAKQFVRISTPLRGEELEDADLRLKAFLSSWLVPGDYAEERERWVASRKEKKEPRTDSD